MTGPIAMYLLREDAGLTTTQVGPALGRDHSTVLHGHARIATMLDRGDAFMGEGGLNRRHL
jgi:chromosomal replication initiation ATPase DnaA